MSQCQTPYATGAGQFPPMKRCSRKSKVKGGPCADHGVQLALYAKPDNSRLKARYDRLVLAFEEWEKAVKASVGDSGQSIQVRDTARTLIAVARGH